MTERLGLADRGVKKLAEALTLPIITWPGAELTEEQKTRVTLERFAKNARLDFSDEATDFEVCIYMMTTSLARPLDHTSYKIYMHAFSKTMPEQFGALFPTKNAELEADEERAYHELARWIYREQVKGYKQKRQLSKGA